jgi:hypothetical protein
MCRPRQTLYTKQQLLQILTGWECTEPLPQKGKKLLVCWPSMPEMEVDPVRVESSKNAFRKHTLSATGATCLNNVGNRIWQSINLSFSENHVTQNPSRILYPAWLGFLDPLQSEGDQANSVSSVTTYAFRLRYACFRCKAPLPWRAIPFGADPSSI